MLHLSTNDILELVFDSLGGALFILAHFKALCFITSHFPSYLFPSITNDIHIICPPLIVSFAYEHFETKFCVMSFYSTSEMCSMVTF